MNPSAKLSICLYSDANFLAVNILENLLSRNCTVTVVTKNVNDWKIKSQQLSANTKLQIVDRKYFDLKNSFSYAIYCGGFIKVNSAYSDYLDFISLVGNVNTKILSIFPIESFDRNQLDNIRISNNIAVIYTGDLVGPRINLESDLLISTSISEIIWKRKLTLAVGEVFFPIFVADAVKTLVKWLFSFGPYGKVTLLLGTQTSGDTFWKINQKFFNELEIKYDTKLSVRIIPQRIDMEIVNSNLNFSLSETYSWLKNNWKENIKPVAIKKETPKVIKEGRRPNFKKVKPFFLSAILLLAFPFITLLISVFISFVAYKSFFYGNDGLAQNSLLMARTFAVISEKGSGVLSYIPGAGLIYKETKFAAVLLEQVNTVGIHAIPAVRDASQLFENILGNEVYDSRNISLRIESEIALLYNDVVLTKSLTDNASVKNIIFAKKILSRVDFERYIKLVSEGRKIAGNLPELLGQNKSKTYMVLFENNMELRPTGGFIGSFGLLTFDAGRLSDLTVNDVYSADGQLNGHVEPPAPIKNYLGEANWWFRDSNWDPDFPTSAKRAEWFLDKELSKQVDGVIATDLYPIKEVLKSIGPVFLSDYNMSITSENLYEKTQSEVEENFFPGSRKKASFLTALSRSLLAEIAKPKLNQKIDLLKNLYTGLSDRHIQVYLHDARTQESISVLGWDGAIATPGCGESCYADLVGVVEANVGMNKVNYFIKRKIDVNVTIGKSEIGRKLTLTLINPANPALGPSGRYKAYIRLLVPSDATFISAIGYNGNVQEILSPEITDQKDRKEVGVLVEILAGNTKNIEFLWSSKLKNDPIYTNYGLYVRKQAGTEEDPITVNIDNNEPVTIVDPRLSLTREGTYGYNTTLARDLFLRLSW